MEDFSNDKTTTNRASATFGKDVSFVVNEAVGSASISPSGRDVVLASQEGLHIIDLDNPYSPPRHLSHRTPFEVADVQWSPFATKDYWVCSTSNQKALVWNLEKSTIYAPIEHVLHAHSRAITDINFSAHHPEILATCAVDSHIHCWDLRSTSKPSISFCDFAAGATQVKYNRQDSHVLASSHDQFLRIWDDRMGIHPLKSIEAHKTKIYGVDWNRTNANCIITCSLDKTIKFWDYSQDEGEPDRIIRTPFPVWRARHTPFGWGVLAMPQRGSNELHLFDSRPESFNPDDGTTTPVHSFLGHQKQVKEFLWRTQNSIENSIDHRDFQLVSWGTDRNLRLHRVEDKVLETVGHKRNALTHEGYNLTRKGAVYKTFNDVRTATSANAHSMAPPAHGLSSIFRNALKVNTSRSHHPDPGRGVWPPDADGGGMHIKSSNKRQEDQIAWMKGVKIVKSEDEVQYTKSLRERVNSIHVAPWDNSESLGDEIVSVGDRYKEVAFDDIDVSGRSAIISLNGPWGIDSKLVYVKLSVDFPEGYPTKSPATFKIEKTSSIPDATFNRLNHALRIIAERCAFRRHGCLEPLFAFLLGEQGLEDIITTIMNDRNGLGASDISHDGDSSSDDEDGLVGNLAGTSVEDMDTSAADIIDLETANANVPVAKGCGALWADDGRLICFFPPRPKLSVIADLHAQNEDKPHRAIGMFGGYGRLYMKPSKRRQTASNSSDDSASDLSESLSSSAGSATSEENLNDSHTIFQASMNLRGNLVRQLHINSTDGSHHSSGALANKPDPNGNQHVVLYEFVDILPSRKALAEEYMIFGNGPKICLHNAEVAATRGLQDLEEVWRLCAHILNDDVPLEFVPTFEEGEDVLVLARRAIIQIKRRDSGLDLSFDRPDSAVNPKVTGRVKWGRHPLAGKWLVPLLFDYFEQLADIQMLAMLACIFSEPAADSSINNLHLHNHNQQMPMPLEAPAFSFDYFPSEDVAWAYKKSREFQEEVKDASPNSSEVASAPFNSYANGRWSPKSTEEVSRQSYPRILSPPTAIGRSLLSSKMKETSKASPLEQHQPILTRPNASIGGSFAASFSSKFPFISSASSSPPNFFEIHRRSSSAAEYQASLGSGSFTGSPYSDDGPVHALVGGRSNSMSRYEDELPPSPLKDQTSAQSDYDEDVLLSGRWTRLSDRSRNQERSSVPSLASIGFSPVEGESSFAEEVLIDAEPDAAATVLLKNQHLFDDEGFGSVPLLDPGQTIKFKAYRETYAHLLFVWGLNDKRCEVLKFNGLTPYFLEDVAAPATTIPTQRGNDPGMTGGKTSWQGFSLVANSERKLHCSICQETVVGLLKACLRCGHVSHMDCLMLWIDGEPEEHDRECEAGCGCICTVGPAAANATTHAYFDADGHLMTSPVVPGDWERDSEWGATEWGAITGIGQAHSRIVS